MDYGFTHPTVVYLFTEFDGKIIIVDEFRARKQLVSENAHEIISMFRRHGVELWRLETFVAGKDVFAQRGSADGKTIADQYEDAGITLTPANDDRVNGWAELLKLFGDADHDREPQIEISTNCGYLIECIPTLQHNPNKPEDVLKTNANEEGDGGDDEADAARYGAMAYSSFHAAGSFETGIPYAN